MEGDVGMKTIYYLDESPYHPGKYMIYMHHNFLPKHVMRGSYHILDARLMMLSYAKYLRLCRDVYGAELFGKNSFVVPYFSDKKKAQPLINELNKRINEIL